MTDRATNIENEIASIERKADQSCTIHADLRDRYKRLAGALDYGLIAATTYLLGLTFVEPTIGIQLSLGFSQQTIVAVLSLVTFFLSIVQFKSDWKSKAEEHEISSSEYAVVKKECRMITSGSRAATSTELQRIRAIYDAATEKGTQIPENAFVRGKANHVRKVYISKYLDSHPGAWVPLLRFKLFVRDNLGIDLIGST